MHPFITVKPRQAGTASIGETVGGNAVGRYRVMLQVLILVLVATSALGATPIDTTIAFYHGTPDRAGHYIVPGLDWHSAGSVRRDPVFDGRVEGHIYAQPLYWRPPGADRGLVIVATESNFVYALDSVSGRVVWRTAVGRPASRAALPCGNIDPLGITGTPVIDAARGAVFFDAMNHDRDPLRHLVYGLSLATGSVLPGFPIDVGAALAAGGIRFIASDQNQRGAMALVDDRIFIPFGGHWGDCGDYHGVVVGIGLDPPRLAGSWMTRAPKGGIWAPGGLSEAQGSLFFSTGNTEGARGWGDGEGVFKVGPDLSHSTDARDFFAPANWQQLDDDDLDLGGVTPLPLTVPGSPAALLLALGKDGNAHLLNRAALGGIGGALAVHQAARRQIITSAAAWTTRDGARVAYQARWATCPDGSHVSGIATLAVTGNAVRAAWCAPMDGAGAPIVTTGDGTSDPIVWVAGAEGDDLLHGFHGDTGAEVYGGTDSRMDGLRHFVTILVAAGRFYVAGDGRIFSFTLPQ